MALSAQDLQCDFSEGLDALVDPEAKSLSANVVIRPHHRNRGRTSLFVAT